MNWTYNQGVITVPQINGGTADIDLRTIHHPHTLYRYAREAEKASQWAIAAEIWEIGGMLGDAEACAIIAAIEVGDQIRAKNFEQ